MYPLHNLNSSLPGTQPGLMYPPCPQCEKGTLLQQGNRVECVGCNYRKDLFVPWFVSYLYVLPLLVLCLPFFINPLNWGHSSPSSAPVEQPVSPATVPGSLSEQLVIPSTLTENLE
jgi:hypothetical protein